MKINVSILDNKGQVLDVVVDVQSLSEVVNKLDENFNKYTLLSVEGVKDEGI